MKCDIRNHSSMTGIEKVAEELYKFAQKQLGFDKPARVVFESQGDRAADMFAPTGNYNPETHTIKIFVDHRHPKDILRSMAHELVHHSQCCMGEFDSPVNTSPGYAQKDGRMRSLEKDAYFWGNGILFRDWEDNHKQKRSWNIMNESKKMSLNEQKLRRKVRRMIMETLQEQDIPADVNAATQGEAAAQSAIASAARSAADIDVDEMEADVEGAIDEAAKPDFLDLDGDKDKDEPMEKAAKEVEEGKGHGCASHVKENLSGREGRCINHTLLEDGSVTHYTVEFQNEIVENIPVGRLTILEMNEHMHGAKRDDYDHDEDKPRMPFEEGEELEEVSKPAKQPPESPPGYIDGGSTEHRRFDKDMAQRRAALEEEQPLEEWYNNTLHEALLKKFKIKK